jgi:hypothetical protein
MADILYHASPNKDLEIIEPKRTLSKNRCIGKYVFATSDKKLAAMYLATKGNATLMGFEHKNPWIVICANPNDYLEKDQGGAVYTLPAKTFSKTPQKGLEYSEMVSKKKVKPINKTIYKTSLQAMSEQRIKVYFVEQEKFNELLKSRDQNKLVKELEPYN